MRYIMKFAILSTLLAPSVLSEPLVKVTKIWEYGYKTRAAWHYVWTDAWDGLNYWCVAEGDECGLWDWKAVYYQIKLPEDPCPECNTPEYGDQLVRRQAQQQGIQLPEDLPLPTFRIIEE